MFVEPEFTQKNESEGRITKIKKDVYERLKKDSKYKKLSVDQFVDQILRQELFGQKKSSPKRKADFLGYCPNCSAMVKQSTLKAEAAPDQEVGTDKPPQGWLSRLMGKK